MRTSFSLGYDAADFIVISPSCSRAQHPHFCNACRRSPEMSGSVRQETTREMAARLRCCRCHAVGHGRNEKDYSRRGPPCGFRSVGSDDGWSGSTRRIHLPVGSRSRRSNGGCEICSTVNNATTNNCKQRTTNNCKKRTTNNRIIPAWNSLPTNLVSSPNVNIFKRRLRKIDLNKFLAFPSVYYWFSLCISKKMN